MSALTDILLYYADRLIAQFRDQPKARGMIQILGKQIIADDVASSLALAFSIDTAVGPQLDILGKYIGVSRYIGEAAPSDYKYFGFTTHSLGENKRGMCTYASPSTTWIWYKYQYSVGIPTALGDDAYRYVLKLQIISNSSDGTLYSIQKGLIKFFGTDIICTDNLDMSLIYNFAKAPPLLMSIVENYLPRPMGVTISTSLSPVYPAVRIIRPTPIIL